jgi:hypothetical protein
MAEVKVTGPGQISVVVNTSRAAKAEDTTFDPSGTSLTSTNLEGAVKEIADRFFQGEDTPTEGLNEGDLWYDDATGEIKVYSE